VHKEEEDQGTEKVFLATNISEFMSGLIPIKDPRCPHNYLHNRTDRD